MRNAVVIIFLCSIAFNRTICSEDVPDYKWPTIGISILVRNKGHTLPYFLSCLHNLDYPKDRLYLWMYSDYNEDNSQNIIEKWAEMHAKEYNGVYITTNSSSGLLHPDEKSPTHWSKGRFKHVIQLREESLEFAKKMWADYLFMVDADVFLTEKLTLKILVNKNVTVASPMLLSDGLYSNFWCGMTEKFYYQRTDDYEQILRREKQGCYEVPMVNTAVLVSLRRKESDFLTYDPRKINDYKGPDDDIIAFAISAKMNGISLNICNDRLYGFILVPLEESDELSKDYDQLLNIKLEAISRKVPLTLNKHLEEFVTYPKPSKFKCSEVYMINLERRTEKRELMEMSFKELGIDAKLFVAVDGMKLDLDDLQEYSITLMPDYEDPFHKRPMKAGEIGCFLSHYYIWKEIVEKHHSTALVLEDDVHFVPYFRQKFLRLLDEIRNLEWDLVYIGRKILLKGEEQYVTDHTTRPLYSYWTLGYLISERGAKKLLDARPLTKVLPVDEFLPIMFDQHPNDTWKAHFPNRNLIALSAAPLLAFPIHYTGEEGYISDTEDSNIIEIDQHDNAIKHEL
ncbi:glycosyltransferase 25 family member [Achroia grisella]|uniref:glycosyltransferase 25 family member n=1 Tax=Achroia grisella TaxID=688607 RepID=UPI0027D32610|nr:glycosyltransferase 25 family member [Achroia grisella]